MAMADTPVVLLNGARQTGKTTLALEIVAGRAGAVYHTLDDASTLAAAVNDPNAFVGQPGSPLVIDEVQRVPELFSAIKLSVDRNRHGGRYLLTGSANVLLLPRLAESLAGRMEIVTLEPLSQRELEGRAGSVMDDLFADRFRVVPSASDHRMRRLAERVMAGGYPEALVRREGGRRDAWFGAYVTAILHRDVRDLANIEGLTDMPRLLALLASRTACLHNVAELSRSMAIPHNTLKRYLTLLQATYLIAPMSAWSRNLGKRLIKAPRLHMADTGLAAHLMGMDAARATRDATAWGRLFESFVVGELRKQASWAERTVTLSHFRTAAGREVDVVLEDRRGRIVGIEIKASSTLRADDFAGLKELAACAGSDWVRGVVLYTGDTPLPFGETLWSLPVDALWGEGEGS